MNPTRIILSGGGTGGHIFPAIAIANALKSIDPKCEILFVGANGRMEMEKVPAAGYPIKGLNIAGLQRSLSLSNLSFPFKVIGSLLDARKIIQEFNPDVAVGVGGYASGPLLFMASIMGIPTLIQEQNSFAGITNKILGKKAHRICVAYEGMEKFFPKDRILLTGNPVRKDILDLTGKRELAISKFGLDPNKPILLSIGGSLGARTINESLFAGSKQLEESGIQVLWQTGKTYFSKAKEKQSEYIQVYEFIKEMDLVYAAADVVISRAGASSISELCLVAKPCILVPSPNVSEDHQTKNAMALVNKQAALLVKDTEAGEKLTKLAIDLISNKEKQKQLQLEIAKLGLPDSANQIAKEVLNLVAK
ncbi:MAG: undecaprenyldiphospho-muramoylpentapeptide beta-N-acetylglucosaminyltransferase [Bacteroidia bacterium]|nr:undecaprenyldiphospho-muramoylpentapeptide beta-N-acetylglucosaminyltransferase [Bacteroidia bacterium]